MKAITHENFDIVLNRCKNGLSNIAIITHYKRVLIKAIHIKKWEDAGIDLIEKDTKSQGFYFRRGKHKDYIFPANVQPILFEIPV